MIDLSRHQALMTVLPAPGRHGLTADEISIQLGRGLRAILADLSELRDAGIVERLVHDPGEDPQHYTGVARWTLAHTHDDVAVVPTLAVAA